MGYDGHPSIDVAWRLFGDPRFSAIPTIALSDLSYSTPLSDTTTIIDNCDGRIAKPVSLPGFYRPIEKILDRARIN